MQSNPGVVGAGRHRHHVPVVGPAQRRRPAVPGPVAQPRPRLEPAERLVGPGQAVRGARLQPAAPDRASAATARPSSPTRIRATRAARSPACRSAANGGATQTAGGSAAHVHRPGQRHRRTRSRAGAERGGLGSVERRPRTPSPRPDRRIGPGSINASHVGRRWGRPQLAGRQRQRQRRSRSTRSRQRRSVRGRRAGDVDAPRPASPTAPRTRSRCGPATTSAAAHGRPARQATTNGPPNQPERTERLGAGDGTIEATLGHPERQRPRDRPLRCRHRSGRQRRTVNGTSTSWNATNGTELPGPRPGLQRGGLRAVERVEPDRHDSAIAGRRDGQLLRRRARASRTAAVRAARTCGSSPPGLQPNTTYTVTCRWTGNPGGFSASTSVDRLQRHGSSTTRRCYYG